MNCIKRQFSSPFSHNTVLSSDLFLSRVIFLLLVLTIESILTLKLKRDYLIFFVLIIRDLFLCVPFFFRLACQFETAGSDLDFSLFANWMRCAPINTFIISILTIYLSHFNSGVGRCIWPNVRLMCLLAVDECINFISKLYHSVGILNGSCIIKDGQ